MELKIEVKDDKTIVTDVGLVSVKKSKEAKFSKIGVRDSKMLTPRKREFLYDEILSIALHPRTFRGQIRR